MLAIVVLGLLVCEGVASFKFMRTRNYNRVVDHSDGYGHAFLNRQKIDIFNRKELLDEEIESIYRQKDALERRIEYINKQKERLDKELENIDNEIDKINPHYGPPHAYPKFYDSRYNGQRKGNEYIVIMPLSGYKEEEISVKAENGRLEINAIHDVPDEPVISYIHRRDLPNDVDPNGSWSYKWGVLRVCFPSIQNQNHFFPTFTGHFSNKVFTEKDISYNENPTTPNVVLNGVFENSSIPVTTQNYWNSDNNMGIPLSTTQIPVIEDKEAKDLTTDITKPFDVETTTLILPN